LASWSNPNCTKPKRACGKDSPAKTGQPQLGRLQKNDLAGTADECTNQLQVYLDLGVTYFMLYFADLPRTEGLKLFAEGVVEKLG